MWWIIRRAIIIIIIIGGSSSSIMQRLTRHVSVRKMNRRCKSDYFEPALMTIWSLIVHCEYDEYFQVLFVWCALEMFQILIRL